MTHAIVPPYLLARIAAAREPTWARAAQAARATLETPREYRPVRSRLRMSIEEPGTLVVESVPAPDRTISDAKQLELLPGVRVRGEDDPPTGDVAVDEAFDGLGATFDFFWDAYQRNSIDGTGGPLLATVHYGRDYDNAFWNGERMVFGDGDGEVFVGFTGSLTVIAHELAHGVTEYEGGLVYQGQSGALNESISDVFGSLTEQHHREQTVEDASWLIGEGIFTAAVQGVALRSLRCARNGVRRRRARARSAARPHGRLRPHQRRQRGRAHQLRHPEPRLLPGRPRSGRPCLGTRRADLVPHADVGHGVAHRGFHSVRTRHPHRRGGGVR